MAYALPSLSRRRPDPCGEAALAPETGHLTKLGSDAATAAGPVSPAQSKKVVLLIGDQNGLHDDPDAPLLSWLGAFQLIRDVGAKVRSERDHAEAITQQSQSLIRGTIAQVKEAELRADVEATTAAIAVLRADRAEVRARLAEERAQQAEDQALAAQADEKESQHLLRRLHAKLNSKCDGMTTITKHMTMCSFLS